MNQRWKSRALTIGLGVNWVFTLGNVGGPAGASAAAARATSDPAEAAPAGRRGALLS